MMASSGRYIALGCLLRDTMLPCDMGDVLLVKLLLLKDSSQLYKIEISWK